jgi:hypothetical protein
MVDLATGNWRASQRKQQDQKWIPTKFTALGDCREMDKEDRLVLGNLPSVKLDSPSNLPSDERALCINLGCNSRLIPNRRFLLGPALDRFEDRRSDSTPKTGLSAGRKIVRLDGMWMGRVVGLHHQSRGYLSKGEY